MLYWILLIYLVVAAIWPLVGLIAFACMIGPVAFSIYKGRYWCGNICPRGSYYDKLIARFSRKRKIPTFLRSVPFRVAVVLFLFTMFGIQVYLSWGDWSAIGRVFWTLILVTTLIGTGLGLFYSPRAWCTFCPMGSLSALVAPRNRKKSSFKAICVDSSCVLCKKCAKVCPMQLKPYEAKGSEEGFLDPDCIKCGVCVSHCPKKAMTMKRHP